MTQINPPFDGSAPCPACQYEVRAVAALLHNTFTRWPEGKAFVTLADLRRTTIPTRLTVPHPAAQELMDVARELVAACDGMIENDLRVKWTPEVREKVGALETRAKAALDAFQPLTDAHFHDRRHASGEENLLREQHGSRWAGFVSPDYAAAKYDHTVTVVGGSPDIIHTVCGTGLRLDAHFLRDLKNDPSFFGRVFCPTCNGNMPIAQFDLCCQAARS